MYQKPFPCPNEYMDFWYQKERFNAHINALSNLKTSIDDKEPEMCSRIINQRKKTSERLLMQQKTSKQNYMLITRAKAQKTVRSTPCSSIYSRAESPRGNNSSNSSNKTTQRNQHTQYTDINTSTATTSNYRSQKAQSSLFPTALSKHNYLTELTFSNDKANSDSPKKTHQFKTPSKKGTFQDFIQITQSNLDTVTST